MIGTDAEGGTKDAEVNAGSLVYSYYAVTGDPAPLLHRLGAAAHTGRILFSKASRNLNHFRLILISWA